MQTSFHNKNIVCFKFQIHLIFLRGKSQIQSFILFTKQGSYKVWYVAKWLVIFTQQFYYFSSSSLNNLVSCNTIGNRSLIQKLF